MRISICVPIYGTEKYITRCAKSLFEQTYADIEYIFINDCTKDNSIRILKEIIDTYPFRKQNVRIINHQVNKGLAAARNTGVLESSGDFILWVDSDDYIDRSLVEKLVKLQKKDHSDIICYDLEVIFSNRVEYYYNSDYINGKDLCLKMLQEIAPHHLCGHLISRDLYIENSIIAKEGINQAEDYQVMPRLAYYAKCISTLHEALYFYDRTNEDSFSNNFNVNKSIQISLAEEVLYDFFKDKEDVFKDQLEFSMTKSIVYRIKWLSLCGSEVNDHYNDLVMRLNEISSNVKRQLRLDLQLIAYINNKSFVRYVTKISNAIYHFLAKYKY